MWFNRDNFVLYLNALWINKAHMSAKSSCLLHGRTYIGVITFTNAFVRNFNIMTPLLQHPNTTLFSKTTDNRSHSLVLFENFYLNFDFERVGRMLLWRCSLLNKIIVNNNNEENIKAILAKTIRVIKENKQNYTTG